MTGLFLDRKKGEIVVPRGESQDVPLLCVEDGDYVCRATVPEGGRLSVSAFVLAGVADSAGSADVGRVNLSLEIDLVGAGAEFRLDGLFIASGGGFASIDVKVNHLSPDATSRQLIKGIATDTATGSFSGMVYVARDAQRTDAIQQNRNLQLTDTAHIFTHPGLEIYADDVKCAHGATVGQLDEEAVYYMRQRGISEAEARRMQLQGFAAEIIDRCPSETIRKVVFERVFAL